MPSNTRTALLALTVALPFAAAAIFPNAPAQGGQFLLSPAILIAEAETTEQEGMMGQGGMGGMMDRGEMGEGEMGGMGGMGGMMNMMQQMSRMMESCDEMMQSMMEEGPDQRPGGGDTEPQQQ